MKTYTFQLELITPCFCAGADQSHAEIRVPSIRGELRWWFRALGGSPQQEQNVFGGISAGATYASKIMIRILNQSKYSGHFVLPSMKMNTPLAYIWYFANASGKPRGQQSGPRFSAEGMLPPGSKFDMEIRNRRIGLQQEEENLLEKSIWAFCHLGSIGYRATRGAGAWRVTDAYDWKPLSNLEVISGFLPSHGFDSAFLSQKETFSSFSSWQSCMHRLESCLKYNLRKQYSAGKSGDKPSPLGSAKPRQRSGLRLRPFYWENRYYALIFFKRDFLNKLSDRRIQLKGTHISHPIDNRITEQYILL